jgi:hypothetical protein
MNKYKGRIETSKKGFIPGVLEFDGYDFMDAVLDEAFVEYGTGCWIYTGDDEEYASEAQVMLWNLCIGGIPTGHYVFNTCSDYRVCFNPNCLDSLEHPEFDWTVEYPGGEDS